MKRILVALIIILAFTNSYKESKTECIINSDIANFWEAYDKIIATKDSVQQYDYLKKIFIEKATPGLVALMEAREYTMQSYIDAINNYPLFWNSVRANTLRSNEFKKEIAAELVKLKELYPPLKPAKIYFTIGALRTNGTTLNDLVLIGSELALTDKNTVATEFPPGFATNRRIYFDSNPINNVVSLNVHEYVHTQQKPMVYNLLSECIYEGVAEFVTVISTGKPSVVPAVNYGKTNELKVKAKFEEEMFNMHKQPYWLWSDTENEFLVRDLGYYIGYALCEIYYNKAEDKKKAIKFLIELDYTNEKQIENFVDGTNYFSSPINQLQETFEKSRPTVVSITQFANGDKNVDPTLTRITLNFSAPMDKEQRGFDYGPLGENNVLRAKSVIGFSEDGKSFTYEVELTPGHRYQSLVTNNFRTTSGVPLKPFLIDIQTAGK